MPTPNQTVEEYVTQLQESITSRTTTHDPAYGPVRDLVIDPAATVLAQQNDRIRAVSLLISLVDPANLSEADLDRLVFNEGLRRTVGARATTTLTFRVAAVDVTGPDFVIPRGFPVGAEATTTGTVTFVTTEAATLDASNASAYFNVTTQRFELSVPARAVAAGTSGNVAARRITRPLRPLADFDEVTNVNSATGGRGRESNAELVERYLLAVLGRDLSTPRGVERWALDTFPEVVDVLVDDAATVRGQVDPGAVDVFVVGASVQARTDSATYLGINQLIPVEFPPVERVTSVESGGTTYTEGTDYEVVLDTSAYQGSARAVDAVRFIPGGSAPAVGATVNISYVSNNLIRELASATQQRDTRVLGRDLLWRQGLEVPLIIEAQLRVATGFNVSTVQSAVSRRILAFIEGLGMGDDVERSDIQGEVRRVSGVDNFIFTRVARSVTGTGVADLSIATNEYATLAPADLTLTLI